MREHGVDAGHRDRLRHVDRDDPRVRVRAADGVAPEHPRGLEVARVRELAGDLRHGVGATRASSRRGRGAASASRVLIDRPPACTASRIFWYPVQRQRLPGERLADLVVRRIGHAAQEIGRGDDETRRAEAALHGAGIRECLLHGMERRLPAETLDGDDLVPVRLRREDEARAHELAVEEHRARAALALLARVLRAGKLEPVAQRRQEALAGPDLGLARLAVDGQLDLSRETPLERPPR